MSPNSNMMITGGTFNFVEGDLSFSSKTATDRGIDRLFLKVAPGAFHDSAERSDPPKCHPNTRVAVIQHILDWLDDPNSSELVMWLHGAAGAGKSAIAQTIAQMLFEQGRLSGSFFSARGSTTGRGDVKRLIPTLAYQLAKYLPETRAHIAAAVLSDPAIFDLSPLSQVQNLLVNPLRIASNALSSSYNISPGLFIIDGLDECCDAGVQCRILQVFASALSAMQHHLPQKFLITSRSEIFMTGSEAVHHYAPATTLAGVTQAIKTWSPSNWLMDLDITATNEAVGAPPETFQVKTRAGEPLTSTELVDISAHHESVVDDYTHFPEVADVQPQVSLADLRSLRETANIVKTYVNTADVLRALEAGEQYDFVRLPDKRYRVVKHSDAKSAVILHPNKGLVGHTSLMNPGTAVFAAGEIHVNQKGVITDINCRSGLPFEIMVEQMDQDFPRAVLNFDSPTFTNLFANVGGSNPKRLPPFRTISIYSTSALIITTLTDPKQVTFQNASYIVGFYEKICVRMIGFADEAAARTIYGKVSSQWAKILMDKPKSKMLLSDGENKFADRCKEEILKFKVFLVTHGRHASSPLDKSPYVVAFHRQDCVKMIGCPDPQLAEKVYNNVSSEWAKILMNRRELVVSHSYGRSECTDLCKEDVLRIPALDDTVPLQISPYIVAFYKDDCVRLIGFRAAESAEAMYDALSACAKVRSDMAHSKVLASYGDGYYVKLCEGKISQLDNFITTAGLEHALYIVAMHQPEHDRVRMIGFSTEGAARAIYNAASNQWPKVLVDRRRSQVLVSYGDRFFVKICEQEVTRIPLFEDSSLPVYHGPYIVSFHQSDRVRMIGLSTEGAARTAYDVISTDWAKVMLDARRPEELAAYGDSSHIEQCRYEARELDAMQSTTPLHTASFIVAFHQGNRVRLFGSSRQKVARAMYDAVSNDWAKVLMNRRYSDPLAWHGGSCVVLCRQAVLSLSTLEDTAPLRSAHYLVGYHRDNRVWIIGFFELDLAQGFYNVIDNDLVKVLMDSKRSETLSVHSSGFIEAVKKCKEELMRPNKSDDETVPLKTALYVVAIHHSDIIRMIGFSEEGHARALYDSVATPWAKVLMKTKKSEVLESYGDIVQCKRAVLRL